MGAHVAGVPVDAQGIQVDLIPDGTRLIYVTPSHQFPLGMPMSLARREALLARAVELGAIIIEDDYDSEFRYEGRPTDSLQSMDSRGVVTYVGTFSKTLLPSLRITGTPDDTAPRGTKPATYLDWQAGELLLELSCPPLQSID